MRGQRMCEINGIIAEIQRFSTGDGPGIRSTLFCKGCNLHCDWCHNPETISRVPQTVFYKNLCKNCGTCQNAEFRSRENVCLTGALKKCGYNITPSEAAKILLEDKPFYDSSGGGVTFSGGEPLLQPEFIKETSKLLKKHDVNIIIDTALNVDYSVLEKLNPFVDYYFSDLKGIDANECYKNTGAELDLVISNLKRLIIDEKEIVIRIPVIPGYSDSPDYMSKASQIVKEVGAKYVTLIPFHNLGSAKYISFDKTYEYNNTKSPTKEQLSTLISFFDNATIEF